MEHKPTETKISGTSSQIDSDINQFDISTINVNMPVCASHFQPLQEHLLQSAPITHCCTTLIHHNHDRETDNTDVYADISARATSHSVRRSSWPRPRSRTDQFHNGFVFAPVTPSGTIHHALWRDTWFWDYEMAKAEVTGFTLRN